LRMVQDPQTLCHRQGLTYVESSELGLRRRRCGKGFSYVDPSGRTVRDRAVRARIKALAIPPAWTDVCIAHDGRAHIQAIGRDAQGRLQYRYHPEWEHVRSAGKERRLLRFGSALPRVRSAVKEAFQLRRPTGKINPRKKTLCRRPLLITLGRHRNTVRTRQTSRKGCQASRAHHAHTASAHERQSREHAGEAAKAHANEHGKK
jgi:DNA topoisomerase I